MNESISQIKATAYSVPTDSIESDGTAEWDSTTLVLVELLSGRVSGIGYSYAHEACASVVLENLSPLIRGKSPLAIPSIWNEMNTALRNFGRPGIAASAIAAVDIALWDLKAKILKTPLLSLLGTVRNKIPVYGSGGFTSYSDRKLQNQFENWVKAGISMVKMKVGRDPGRDESRVKAARKAIGKSKELFVDANGAFTAKEALRFATLFSKYEVSWFEEPVSSDDLKGLGFLREHGPTGMEIAAGEYNYDSRSALRMLESKAVDALQADATRCGVTGFLETAALCEAFQVPLSAHTAPALHAHLCCVVNRARHVEYFHDHVRIEQLLFEGRTTNQKRGFLEPDLSCPGLGLEFKHADAAKFKIL